MRRPFSNNWILTQGFGENPTSYSRFGLKGHNGLDYGLPTGTEVLAPHDGTVIEATNDPTGYGNYLKIENDKEGSVLAHLQSFKVVVGQKVTEGQVIGISNNTGNSTGPHLHWGYYLFPRNRQNGYAGFIDQAPLLPPREPADTLDSLRKQRDDNWNLYQQAKAEADKLRLERDANWNKYQEAQAKYDKLKTAVQKATTDN